MKVRSVILDPFYNEKTKKLIKHNEHAEIIKQGALYFDKQHEIKQEIYSKWIITICYHFDKADLGFRN